MSPEYRRRGSRRESRRREVPWIAYGSAAFFVLMVVAAVGGLMAKRDRSQAATPRENVSPRGESPAIVAAPRQTTPATPLTQPPQPPQEVQSLSGRNSAELPRLPRLPVPTTAKPPLATGAESPRVEPPGTVASLPAPPAPLPPYKSDRPATEKLPGYFLRTIGKPGRYQFQLLVSRMAYNESDELRGEPLKMIDAELARIMEIFPDSVLKTLSRVPVWIEWDHTLPREKNAIAVYYGARGESFSSSRPDALKANSICILSLKTILEMKASGEPSQTILLHEYAHAVHDQIYPHNPIITDAYQQAMERYLYRANREDGWGRRHAARNESEYFAELTCAYLDTLNYKPRNAKELKEYDSVGYEMMEKAWGTLSQLEAARKLRKN